MAKNYGIGGVATVLIWTTIASLILSLIMGLPFLIGAFKIFTNTKILITIIIVIGLVAIVKAKRQPRLI